MKKKNVSENYLDRIPMHSESISWTTAEDGKVTLEIENKGIANRIAQKLLKKPKTSYVYLDELGSFVWPLIDGERSILSLGEDVDAHFGEKAHPLYERLAQFFRILDSYNFISWKSNS